MARSAWPSQPLHLVPALLQRLRVASGAPGHCSQGQMPPKSLFHTIPTAGIKAPTASSPLSTITQTSWSVPTLDMTKGRVGTLVVLKLGSLEPSGATPIIGSAWLPPGCSGSWGAFHCGQISTEERAWGPIMNVGRPPLTRCRGQARAQAEQKTAGGGGFRVTWQDADTAPK